MRYIPIEAVLNTIQSVYGLSWEREYYFAYPKFKYRFDYAIPSLKVAIEVEGGVYIYGRHNKPAGYEEDCIKYSLAAAMGWTVLRFTTRQIRRNLFLYPTGEKPGRDYVELSRFINEVVRSRIEGGVCDLSCF